MRAIQYHEHGGPDVLQLDEIEEPTAGEQEVVVDVAAASVNPVDIRFRDGQFTPQWLPMSPGSDFAGVIESVGPGVNRLSVGDRVFGDGLDKGGAYRGSYAEKALAPIEKVARLPDGVDFETAAAAAHVGLTAWRSLVQAGDASPGKTCLIHGASGGVGHIGVQIAGIAGMNIIGTAGRVSARERIETLGADVMLDYARDDLQTAIEAAADDLGAPNIIVDHLLHDYLDLDIAVAADGATIVGLESEEATVTKFPRGIRKDLSIHLTGTSRIPDMPAALRSIGEFLAEDRLSVDIAYRFDLEEAAEAQRTVWEETFVGKTVLSV